MRFKKPSFSILQKDVADPATVISVEATFGKVPLIVADPPYGRIMDETWDHEHKDEDAFCNWLLSWTSEWYKALEDGGSLYVWGGVGRTGFRPFLRYLYEVEQYGFTLHPIVWAKKRAYGKKDDYLFVREELAWLVKGDKPKTFNIPLLEAKRGYAGYNADYPAKSEYFRRTNVWNETEIMRGKLHPCHKPPAVCRVPVEVHTNPGDRVIELFAGCGELSVQAKALGRFPIAIERDLKWCNLINQRLS